MKLLTTAILLATVTLLNIHIAKAQDISCSEIVDLVEDEGYHLETVTSLTLLNSEWLKEVKAYSLENMIFVIALIRDDSHSTSATKYVFCDVPRENWYGGFFNNLKDLTQGLSYGQKFHKYIIDYQCDCN